MTAASNLAAAIASEHDPERNGSGTCPEGTATAWQPMPQPERKANAMDRFIDSIEWTAAIFVGIVAADVFISVLLRYFFNVSIPDSYDFGRLLLGILIFWGIGATSYRGTHITVDLLYANVGPKLQRAMDIFATLVLLFVVAIHSWTLFDKVDVAPAPTTC